MPKTFEIPVVGLRHSVTPATLREMDKMCPLPISLRREPENRHDENAIAVIVQEKPWKGMKVGYVPRQTASEIAPRLDRGKVSFADGLLTSVDADSGIGEMRLNFRRRPISQ